MVFLNATLVSLDLILGNKSGKQSTCVKTVQAKVFCCAFCLFVCFVVVVFAFYSSRSRQTTGRTYRGAFATSKLKANGVHIKLILAQRIYLTLNTLMQKEREREKPSGICKRRDLPKNKRGENTQPSLFLNKGSLSSDVHISIMPKLHSAKTDHAKLHSDEIDYAKIL